MRRLLSVWLWLLAVPAWAEDTIQWPRDLRINGFLSQGYVKTTDNRFFGASDQGSWDLRELGLNASYQLNSGIRAAGLLLSRTAGDMYDGRVKLDYGLLDINPVIHENFRLGVRLGRLKHPLGLYNDTRDVPFTRPSIFLPQSIYFDKVRNLELSSDGAGLYADWQLDGSDLFFHLYSGFLRVDKNVENAFLFFDRSGTLSADEPWVTGRLMYEHDGSRLRLALSGALGGMQYAPAADDSLSNGRIKVEFWIASVQYNTETWSLTAEYMRELVDYRGFGRAAFKSNHALGYYLQGDYRVTHDWGLFARYDVSYLDDDDRDGERLSAITGAPPHLFFAKDVTFGARWNWNSNLMLRAEYHLVEGASWLSTLENDPTRIVREWDMFALQVSYRF